MLSRLVTTFLPRSSILVDALSEKLMFSPYPFMSTFPDLRSVLLSLSSQNIWHLVVCPLMSNLILVLSFIHNLSFIFLLFPGGLASIFIQNPLQGLLDFAGFHVCAMVPQSQLYVGNFGHHHWFSLLIDAIHNAQWFWYICSIENKYLGMESWTTQSWTAKSYNRDWTCNFFFFLRGAYSLKSLLNLLQYCFCFVLFWPGVMAWDLSSLNQESKPVGERE